jgi:hypothetical protein
MNLGLQNAPPATVWRRARRSGAKDKRMQTRKSTTLQQGDQVTSAHLQAAVDPGRSESWPSDEIWRWLLPEERRRVRNKRLYLNILEPNWRPPRHG